VVTVVVPPVPPVAGGGVVVPPVPPVVVVVAVVRGVVVPPVPPVVVGVGASEPAAPPAPAVRDPPVPGAPASDDGALEPEAPAFEEVGVVGLPAEPPVPGLLELPAEPLPPPGSIVVSEPPSNCDPPDFAPDAQPIVRDAASGSSVARERERTLLCFECMLILIATFLHRISPAECQAH
jgi:hypothetical protein